MVAGHHQLAVYLVGDDPHAMAQADVVHACELLACPHPSGGVVGVAEHEQLHPRVGGLALHVVEVHTP